MREFLAAIIIALPLLLGGAQASPSGCTVAGADVAASLASATTCLDIPAGVRAFGPGTTISDNVLSLATGAGVAVMANDAIVSGNQIRVSGNAIGMTLRGDGGVVSGNRITSTGSGAALIFTLSGPTNLLMTGNYLRRAPALGQLFALNLAGVTGRISGNLFDGSYTFSNAAPGVVQ